MSNASVSNRMLSIFTLPLFCTFYDCASSTFSVIYHSLAHQNTCRCVWTCRRRSVVKTWRLDAPVGPRRLIKSFLTAGDSEIVVLLPVVLPVQLVNQYRAAALFLCKAQPSESSETSLSKSVL